MIISQWTKIFALTRFKDFLLLIAEKNFLVIVTLMDTSGSLFRQKTKSKCLSDTNFQITPNPFVAGLVKKMEDWKFSSFRDYAGLRNGTLCNKLLAIKFCSYDPATFIKTSYQIIDGNLLLAFIA